MTEPRQIEPKKMTLLPPPPDCCQVCAVNHAPDEPHNPQSLYWATKREMEGQPPPNWEEALAHVSDPMREAWVEALAERGVVVGPR